MTDAVFTGTSITESGGGQSAVAGVGAGQLGRTSISSRAMRRVLSAITADEMGVAAGDVSIDLADDNGLLAVTASSPISVPALGSARQRRMETDGTGASASSLIAPGGFVAPRSIADRATATQGIIRSRALALTGSTVGTVVVRLTGARIDTEARPR
ncbi:hypothetical protein [Glaciihabitans sp. dw_435]|uniref:hypothetical protein n=1 Tax=Glaciihabitans sp. dw_435 TaxID=2720081 RepID=UPI001C4A2E69|nr:hypothetical protein [Glaciihabitans sp. dw_435]